MNYRNKYSCPRCGSDHTQKYSSIYSNGITHHSATAEFEGEIDHGSRTSNISGNADINGMSITNLAKSCAPPEKESYGSALGFIFLEFFPGVPAKLYHGDGLYVMIAFFVFGVIGMVSAYDHNNNEYPQLT